MASGTFADLLKYAERQGARMDQIARKALLDVSSSVAKKTPRKTGRAAGNWMASISAPDTSTTTSTKRDSVSKAQSTIDASYGNVYYFVNSLPYIRRLEYLGHSKQAPNGMVRLSLKEFDSYVKDAIKSTR
jgi:hypothetical protein